MFARASEAFQRATQRNAQDATSWANWGNSLLAESKVYQGTRGDRLPVAV
jgi:hypothetical protein